MSMLRNFLFNIRMRSKMSGTDWVYLHSDLKKYDADESNSDSDVSVTDGQVGRKFPRYELPSGEKFILGWNLMTIWTR